MSLTPEQQVALVKDLFKPFTNRLLPAKLADTQRNYVLLAEYLDARKLHFTTDNVYAAVNALYATLDWDIKPHRLLVEEHQAAVAANAARETAAQVASAAAQSAQKAETLIAQAKSLRESKRRQRDHARDRAKTPST